MLVNLNNAILILCMLVYATQISNIATRYTYKMYETEANNRLFDILYRLLEITID